MKKNKLVEVKRVGDENIKISDLKKQIQDFIKEDEKKYIVLGEMIEVSDRNELEMLEMVLLKTFDSVREKMLISDVHDKNDLNDINFFLQIVKVELMHGHLGDMDLSPPSGVFHVS